MELEQIMRALGSLRVVLSTSEYDIHRVISDALEQNGISFVREAQLSPGNRIDFLVDGSIGIEVKKGKPVRTTLIRQLQRYCESSQVRSILVVVERSVSLPSRICGKPCRVLSLHALWGVALP